MYSVYQGRSVRLWADLLTPLSGLVERSTDELRLLSKTGAGVVEQWARRSGGDVKGRARPTRR